MVELLLFLRVDEGGERAGGEVGGGLFVKGTAIGVRILVLDGR